MTITVIVNGEPSAVEEGSTVAALVAGRTRDASKRRGRGVAVAVNGEVVPRSEWESTPLRSDDSVELLNAVGGG